MKDIEVTYARERAMRDAYADDLRRYRPLEQEVSRENLPGLNDRKRADLLTVDRENCLRVWEFKVQAAPGAIGQVQTYLALCRRHYRRQRIIRPVIAAAVFDPDVIYTIADLNLGIETVTLPAAVLNAGKVAFAQPDPSIPTIIF